MDDSKTIKVNRYSELSDKAKNMVTILTNNITLNNGDKYEDIEVEFLFEAVLHFYCQDNCNLYDELRNSKDICIHQAKVFAGYINE